MMAGPGGESQFVTIGLGKEVFGVPVAFVREILDYRQPFSIPDGPPYLLGLTDVRGRSTPTIDLRAKLGLAPVKPDLQTRILVVDVPVGDRVLALGLVADRVIEVIALRAEEIDDAPDIGVPWRSDYIEGVVRRDNGFIVLFALAKLLTGSDVATLGAERAA